jgi:hypothetical protein
MCIPCHIFIREISVEEIANLMYWETRESMDEMRIIPYGVSVDPSKCQVDGIDIHVSDFDF